MMTIWQWHVLGAQQRQGWKVHGWPGVFGWWGLFSHHHHPRHCPPHHHHHQCHHSPPRHHHHPHHCPPHHHHHPHHDHCHDQIWMPDLQIDQAMEIRNPKYLNDASSFRFASELLITMIISMIITIMVGIHNSHHNYGGAQDLQGREGEVHHPAQLRRQLPHELRLLPLWQAGTIITRQKTPKWPILIVKGLHCWLRELRLHLGGVVDQLDAWGLILIMILIMMIIILIIIWLSPCWSRGSW